MAHLKNDNVIRIGSYSVTVISRLAEGGFGFVDLVTDNQSHSELILKRCGISRERDFQIANKEISLLQKFSGPYVVKLLGTDIQNRAMKKEAILLLEYCSGGHLLNLLNKRNGSPLPITESLRLFGQLLLALKPMHESLPPWTHRDLKLENVLIGVDGNVRLCDFGSCVEGYIPLTNASERSDAEEVIEKETTQMYRAPEMIDLYMRTELTEKTDIWALGCILYALCFLTHPFQDAGSLGILRCLT